MAEQTGSQTAGLHLVVPLEQRLDLGASDAVQGELFVDEGARRPTRGYRGTVASKVAGITYRQLDYWARKQIVEPSITPSHGSGSRRLYSFKDVVILAVSKKLLDAGVNPKHITISSDGQGSLPIFNEKGEFLRMGMGQSSCLLKEVKECVEKAGIPLETAISTITANPAEILSLKGKGKIQEGFDADLCVLDQGLEIQEVVARGKTVYRK